MDVFTLISIHMWVIKDTLIDKFTCKWRYLDLVGATANSIRVFLYFVASSLQDAAVYYVLCILLREISEQFSLIFTTADCDGEWTMNDERDMKFVRLLIL